MPKLELITGSKAPDTPIERIRQRLREQKRPKPILQCPRCGCREMIEARTGAYIGARGVLAGGAINILCADCLRRGERVTVI